MISEGLIERMVHLVAFKSVLIQQIYLLNVAQERLHFASDIKSNRILFS